MKLEILKIIDRGVPNKERLWLKVLADCSLTYFAVIDTVYSTPNSISNSPKRTYWFDPKQVKVGDYVILYTCKGTPSESKNPDGSTNYFFYWNQANTLWNKPEDCAVLIELNGWQTTKLG